MLSTVCFYCKFDFINRFNTVNINNIFFTVNVPNHMRFFPPKMLKKVYSNFLFTKGISKRIPDLERAKISIKNNKV